MEHIPNQFPEDMIGAIKIKDGLFIGDSFAAQVISNYYYTINFYRIKNLQLQIRLLILLIALANRFLIIGKEEVLYISLFNGLIWKTKLYLILRIQLLKPFSILLKMLLKNMNQSLFILLEVKVDHLLYWLLIS